MEEKIINELKRCIVSDELAIFVGAGLSMAAGLFGWDQLESEIRKETGAPDTVDFLLLTQVFANRPSGRNRLIKMVQRFFDVSLEPTAAHRMIARLPVSTYLTTNYDRLLDEALKREKGDITPICFNTGIPYQSSHKVKYFKLHGDVKLPDTIVLTKDDYRDFLRKDTLIKNELRHLFATKAFLFVGYSHRDADIDTLMDDVMFELSENKPPIYSTQFNCSSFDQECFKAKGINVINIHANEHDKEVRLLDFLRNLSRLDRFKVVTHRGLGRMASVFGEMGDPNCLAILTAMEGCRFFWKKNALSVKQISDVLGVPVNRNLSDSIQRLVTSGLVEKKWSILTLTGKWDGFIKETGMDRILQKHFDKLRQGSMLRGRTGRREFELTPGGQLLA